MRSLAVLLVLCLSVNAAGAIRIIEDGEWELAYGQPGTVLVQGQDVTQFTNGTYFENQSGYSGIEKGFPDMGSATKIWSRHSGIDMHVNGNQVTTVIESRWFVVNSRPYLFDHVYTQTGNISIQYYGGPGGMVDGTILTTGDDNGYATEQEAWDSIWQPSIQVELLQMTPPTLAIRHDVTDEAGPVKNHGLWFDLSGTWHSDGDLSPAELLDVLERARGTHDGSGPQIEFFWTSDYAGPWRQRGSGTIGEYAFAEAAYQVVTANKLAFYDQDAIGAVWISDSRFPVAGDGLGDTAYRLFMELLAQQQVNP